MVEDERKAPERAAAAAGALAALLLLTLAPAPAGASGFALFEQGARAMGMAGAFAAQADDPSALFYNPGGLAFVKKKTSLGLAVSGLNEGHYQGLPPGIGAGTSGEQERVLGLQPNAYLVKPLSPVVKLGVAAYSPFGFDIEWSAPDSFSGRPISLTSQLRSYDLLAAFAVEAGPRFGFGAGAVVRAADLQQSHRIQQVDPFTLATVDVAEAAVETDFENGFGWTAGLLARLGRLSLGLSYRSSIEIDFAGSGRLTQVPSGNSQLDALIRATFPLDTDLPVRSSIGFPDVATLGLALRSGEKFVIEADAQQTGWSRFKGLAVAFETEPVFSQSLQGPWEDAMSYRLGMNYGPPKGPQWRLGFAFDEAAQPDVSVNPFYADSERTTVAAGFGRDWLDLAVQWASWESRTVLANPEGLNGRYEGSVYRLAISITK